MPNRYEREIEEILRNLEQTEPRQSSGSKYRNAGPREPARQRRTFAVHFSIAEWLLFVAIVASLLGGGIAYTLRATLVTGILGLIGFVCIILVSLSSWLLQPRRPRSYKYGNATITPLRRNPLDSVKTRWNLFRLRRRYRQNNEE